MKNRISLLAPLVGLALAGASGCQKAKSGEATATQPTESLDCVTLALVQRAVMARPIEAAGQLSSETEAQLSFKTGGLVRHVLVKEGDFVQKGQLLATLDLTEINAQVSQAEQGQTKARRDLDRFNRLLADSAAPLEAVQNLRTGYSVAREQARIARFNQQFSEIHAPVAGRVVRKTINEGELALAEAGATIPLALVWGLKDPVLGPLMLQAARVRYSRAVVTALPAVGHFLPVEVPDVVAQALLANARRGWARP